jgi:DNA-nicking Smr family endonuclease
VSENGEDKLSHRPFAGLSELRKVVEQKLRASEEAEPPKPAPPTLSDEARVDEERLFRREMRGVAPLSDRDNFVRVERQASPPPEAREEAEVMARLADLVEGRAEFDFSATDEYIDGIATGLDRRLLKRLRQGYFAVQGHLDLHGRTRQEARPLVEQFLQESRRAGRRCVLIVHGRGRGSKDQIPVLKESLRIWLAKGRIARSVLAFCSARPSDGGAGAVYVLLRK